MTKFKIYAENMNGKRRFLGSSFAADNGNGLFELYADECASDEQIVIVEAING